MFVSRAAGCNPLQDVMAYRKTSNDIKKEPFIYSWKQDGNLRASQRLWVYWRRVFYSTHGCVKPHKSIKVSWLTADVIDNILRRIQPFYSTGPGNGSHCTMTNLSQLQLCT